MNRVVTKKAVVWITLISFTLSCSGCYSFCEGEHYPSRVAYAGERPTAPRRRHVDVEVLTSILIFAVLIATVVTGHSHGYYSTGHHYGSYHY